METKIPTNSNIHAAKHFLSQIEFFNDSKEEEVNLILHPKWMHIDAFGLVAIAAWSDWQRRQGRKVNALNIGANADFAWRMKLFDYVDTNYSPNRVEHEEAGRFLPIRQITNGADIRGVVADISALLHLEDNPDSLAAVQYCVSELLRNVIEHSYSKGGAFVCAQNFINGDPRRVVIAVADCGVGISDHLGQIYPEAQENDAVAIQMAMQPGITGAKPGLYGTTDNAGAGLFITRSIAKGTGGYYLLVSGNSSYRLRRTLNEEAQGTLFLDPFLDRHDMWDLPNKWQGTIVSMEVRTDQIEDFESYFSWIREYVPRRSSTSKKIKFI